MWEQEKLIGARNKRNSTLVIFGFWSFSKTRLVSRFGHFSRKSGHFSWSLSNFPLPRLVFCQIPASSTRTFSHLEKFLVFFSASLLSPSSILLLLRHWIHQQYISIILISYSLFLFLFSSFFLHFVFEWIDFLFLFIYDHLEFFNFLLLLIY